MSISTHISLAVDASGALLALKGYATRKDVRKVAGRAIVNLLRAHFAERDATNANDLGGRRSHFWADVRRSVHQPELVGGDGIKIEVTHVGAALQLYGSAGLPGGVVKPVTADWLTVPARTEAYGKRAREFDDLHFVFFRPDLAALVQNEQTVLTKANRRRAERGAKTETTGGGIFYWLKKEIRYAPHPDVLPTDAEIAAAAGKESLAYINSLNSRS